MTDTWEDVADERRAHAAAGTMGAFWAARHPDRPAIVSDAGARSFAELEAAANRAARALRHRGVGKGDAVALVCRNRPEFAEVLAATLRTGVRLTPINWHLTGGEAAYIAADCGAKALIADATLPADMLEMLSGVEGPAVQLSVGGDLPGWERWDEVIAGEDGSLIDEPSLGTTMLYTSGTTGRPKGVHRPPESAVNAAMALSNFLDYRLDADDVNLCTGPLYHAAPLAFSLSVPLNHGATVVLMDGWDAAEALRLSAEHRVTHTHMVPTMFHRLLSLPAEQRAAADLSAYRMVLHGAAPCPIPVKRGVIEWLGPVVYEYYGATEAGVSSVVDSATWLEHPGTVGQPTIPGSVMIGDPDASPLAVGEEGIIWLRAPETGRFDYYGDPSKTSGSYRGDWFTLGDVGRMDADGFLYLTDRSANLIISGGVNIYPAEVDAVLLEHPAVADVATIGVPSVEWGEEVRAVVELRDGWTPSEGLAAELVDFSRSRIAHFKCPRSVDFVEALPRHDNGKIYKRVLRERYREGAR